uniref:Thyrotropin-releasing hormone receptor n=1 Tax=Meloidogyne incognita TaxID=6306 RepID=A0A914MRL1_MELIC
MMGIIIKIFQNQPLKVVSLLNQVLKVQIDPLLNPMNQNLKQTILGLQTLDVLLLVIKMLALVAFIFAVCWLPYRAMVMYNSFASAINWEPWDYDWLIFMSKTMIFFNCAINPVLYNLMSSRFRKAFRQLLRGQKRHINVYKRGSSYLHDQHKKINGDEGTEMTADIKRFSTIVTSGREEECLNGTLNN